MYGLRSTRNLVKKRVQSTQYACVECTDSYTRTQTTHGTNPTSNRDDSMTMHTARRPTQCSLVTQTQSTPTRQDSGPLHHTSHAERFTGSKGIGTLLESILPRDLEHAGYGQHDSRRSTGAHAAPSCRAASLARSEHHRTRRGNDEPRHRA